MSVSARDHSVAVNPFLQAMLPHRPAGPVYWHGQSLRFVTPDGRGHEVPLPSRSVTRWCQRHPFPALLSAWSHHRHGERFVVEHTSVNPVHPLHAGSLRGSLIGGFLVRLLRSTGASASAHYFVNDLGRQARLLSWILRRVDQDHFPPSLRFDHAAGVLYALVNMFAADRTADLTRLHAQHPWLTEAVKLTDNDRDELARWLADEQASDTLVIRRMLEAALSDLAAIGARIDVVEYESTLAAGSALPADIARQLPVVTINGVLCLRHPGGLIPLTRSDGTWLYFLRDLLNTRRQSTHAPHVLHVIGQDQDLLQQGLRALCPDIAVEHITFATVSRNGRRFSARQNRLVTLADTLEQHGSMGLWELALPMLTRRRHTPFDLTHSPGTDTLDLVLSARRAAETGLGSHHRAEVNEPRAWNVLSTLLRIPEALRRAVQDRSPHHTAVLLLHASREYLRAAQCGAITPWLRDYFLQAQNFLSSLHGLPLDELLYEDRLTNRELA